MKSEKNKCPYCGKINSKEAIKCPCGYYFDKAIYKNKLEEENKKAEEDWNNRYGDKYEVII